MAGAAPGGGFLALFAPGGPLDLSTPFGGTAPGFSPGPSQNSTAGSGPLDLTVPFGGTAPGLPPGSYQSGPPPPPGSIYGPPDPYA